MKKKIYDEEHKKLIDLVTGLPFGYHAEYFYTFMICKLKSATNSEIFELYPANVKEQILQDLEELEQIREEKKAKETEEVEEILPEEVENQKRLTEMLCTLVNMRERHDIIRFISIFVKDIAIDEGYVQAYMKEGK